MDFGCSPLQHHVPLSHQFKRIPTQLMQCIIPPPWLKQFNLSINVFFSPMLDTLCKAIDNDQLIGFPTLTAERVSKYLPASTASLKGHLNCNCQGIRSTSKSRSPDTEADMRPPQDENAEWELYIGAYWRAKQWNYLLQSDWCVPRGLVLRHQTNVRCLQIPHKCYSRIFG